MAHIVNVEEAFVGSSAVPFLGKLPVVCKHCVEPRVVGRKVRDEMTDDETVCGRNELKR